MVFEAVEICGRFTNGKHCRLRRRLYHNSDSTKRKSIADLGSTRRLRRCIQTSSSQMTTRHLVSVLDQCDPISDSKTRLSRGGQPRCYDGLVFSVAVECSMHFPATKEGCHFGSSAAGACTIDDAPLLRHKPISLLVQLRACRQAASLCDVFCLHAK